MTEFSRTRSVDLPPDQVFAFLADLDNLPKYFAGLVDATATGSSSEGRQEIQTRAMVDGQEVQGEAWLERDESNRSLRWGSEGPNDYHGELRVEDDGGGGSTMTVSLNTVRVQDRDGEIDEDLDKTLASAASLLTGE